MPTSHKRKGHSKRVQVRNSRIEESKVRVNKLYQEMYDQLRDKNLSVPDMLNKEDEMSIDALPSQDPVNIVSQWQDLTPEQQQIVDSAVLTTTE